MQLLNRLVCLVMGHVPSARLRLHARLNEVEDYWECARCGKELRDDQVFKNV